MIQSRVYWGAIGVSLRRETVVCPAGVRQPRSGRAPWAKCVLWLHPGGQKPTGLSCRKSKVPYQVRRPWGKQARVPRNWNLAVQKARVSVGGGACTRNVSEGHVWALPAVRVQTWKAARMVKHQECKHEGRLFGDWEWFGTQEVRVRLTGLSPQRRCQWNPQASVQAITF